MATSEKEDQRSGRAEGDEPVEVNLPFVTAKFRRMNVRIPDREDLNEVARTFRTHLPSPGHAAYYAGLGTLAALSIIEWPVAAAIGMATVTALHSGGDRSGSSRSDGSRSQQRSA